MSRSRAGDDDEEEGGGLFSPRGRPRERTGNAGGGSRPTPAPQPSRTQDEEVEDGRANVGPPPGFDGSLTPGVLDNYLLKAKLWLATTRNPKRTRGPRMLAALTGSAFEACKHLVLDDVRIQSETNGQELLNYLKQPEAFGEEREEELLTALSRLFYQLKREKQERSVQFVSRFREAVRKVQAQGVSLPEEALGFLLITCFGLNEDDSRMLLSYTRGSLKERDVVQALRTLEMSLDARRGPHGGKVFGAHVVEERSHGGEELPDDQEETEVYAAALAELSASDEEELIDEDEAKEILLAMKSGTVTKKKTFLETSKAKKVQRIARGFMSSGGAAASAGPIKAGTYKISIEELKKKTKCRSCGMIGHWRRECPKRLAGGAPATRRFTSWGPTIPTSLASPRRMERPATSRRSSSRECTVRASAAPVPRGLVCRLFPKT